MSSVFPRPTLVSRLFESLRLARGLKPEELAALLGASNVSSAGNLIRNFELSGQIDDEWFILLRDELRPNHEVLRRCQKLDEIDAEESARLRAKEEAELEHRRRLAWAKELPHISRVVTFRQSRRKFAMSPRIELPGETAGSLQKAQAFAQSLVASLPPDCERHYYSIELNWRLDERFSYQRDPERLT